MGSGLWLGLFCRSSACALSRQWDDEFALPLPKLALGKNKAPFRCVEVDLFPFPFVQFTRTTTRGGYWVPAATGHALVTSLRVSQCRGSVSVQKVC